MGSGRCRRGKPEQKDLALARTEEEVLLIMDAIKRAIGIDGKPPRPRFPVSVAVGKPAAPGGDTALREENERLQLELSRFRESLLQQQEQAQEARCERDRVSHRSDILEAYVAYLEGQLHGPEPATKPKPDAPQEADFEKMWDFVVQGHLKEEENSVHKGMICFPKDAMARLHRKGIGCVSLRGLRSDGRVRNQDDFVLAMRRRVPQGDVALYGVFDGHGPAGEHCSSLGRGVLPECVFADPELFTRPRAVLARSFQSTQRRLLASAFDTETSGTTAAVALVIRLACAGREYDEAECDDEDASTVSTVSCFGEQDQEQVTWVFTAHVGDSRGLVVAREGCKVWQSTRPHRADDPEEAARVRKLGGEVRSVQQGGSCLTRVGAPGSATLAVTRSLGDSACCCVVAEPEIAVVPLKGKDQDALLVLSTDGLFEFCSDEHVAATLFERGVSAHVLEDLCMGSRRLWAANSFDQTSDDATAVAVCLQSHFD